jgi:hypothetical protein
MASTIQVTLISAVAMLVTACASDAESDNCTEEKRCTDSVAQGPCSSINMLADGGIAAPCGDDAGEVCQTVRTRMQDRADAESLSGRLQQISCQDRVCSVVVLWPDSTAANDEYLRFIEATGCESSVTLPQPTDACEPLSATVSVDCSDSTL